MKERKETASWEVFHYCGPGVCKVTKLPNTDTWKKVTFKKLQYDGNKAVGDSLVTELPAKKTNKKREFENGKMGKKTVLLGATVIYFK